MVVLNEIGPFNFISLAGNPEAVREEVELVRRAGVDGVGIWRIGQRGRPFTLRSFVDAPTIGEARLLFSHRDAGYVSLIGTDPVSLLWTDIRLDPVEGVLVAVLDVRQVECFRIAPTATGGLNASPQAFLICDWDLVLIRI